ncbi:MAG: protein kinase [Deltaproteobacteria bacterium]|nr:protein kinase [Deltaproteobacteria bacterium]
MATRTKRKRAPYFDMPPGRTLGSRYQVLDLLGFGWEGEVYKVVERHTGIERAAKLFYPHRSQRGRALLNYARKLNKLKDVPVIIQYHHRDVTRFRGQQIEFMVSEYVDGEQLSTLLDRQAGHRFTSFEALHILYAICEGIAPIHIMGEYHGDLHTDNVVIRRKGIGFGVKLLDFFDFGRPSKAKIHSDVLQLIDILYELVGAERWYARCGPEIRQLVCGRKHSLILRKFQTAGQLKNAIQNLRW